jgi:murein DD-endopeptidase MepM/ murein hydrolase activator NlpD
MNNILCRLFSYYTEKKNIALMFTVHYTCHFKNNGTVFAEHKELFLSCDSEAKPFLRTRYKPCCLLRLAVLVFVFIATPMKHPFLFAFFLPVLFAAMAVSLYYRIYTPAAQVLAAQNTLPPVSMANDVPQPLSLLRSPLTALPEGQQGSENSATGYSGGEVLGRFALGKGSSPTQLVAYDQRTVLVQGHVSTSLHQALADAGETADLESKLEHIFGKSAAFLHRLRHGDSLTLVVEKFYTQGVFASYGKILGVRILSRGKKHEAFYYADERGEGHYYAAEGTSLTSPRFVLPLRYSYISDSFSMSRRHPVLFRTRPHEGIDYVAPRGTQVHAASAGVVESVGWMGGFGKTVLVRHADGYYTQYAHLSGYAKALNEGDSVAQGALLGYVGSSGLSTGNHLDFRIKRYGRYINPAPLLSPAPPALAERAKGRFYAQVAVLLALMNGEKSDSPDAV